MIYFMLKENPLWTVEGVGFTWRKLEKPSEII